ncbi:MAG: hypothetical protein HYZ28_19735 [Myxococcales bacterium]|nr:hypothetical protein [Myxococcales bacterium]
MAMSSRALLLALWLPALGQASAATKRVVVLYFDNNTNRRDYDVLQKGLADMLVTDLAAVEALQVVEREKLQALIDELKLQRTSYFDPKTAQKLGKLAGAEFAVTGALAELEPKLRIDIRLIEVVTANLILADKVTGSRDAFFDLQQELVDRFVQGLNVKLKASARARSGMTDVDTLLKYSRGVDAADRGDLQGASNALAEVVRDSPDFRLAQSKYAVLLKRLEEAGKKRTGILGGLEAELLKAAEARTKGDLLQLLPPGPPGENENSFNQRYHSRRDALALHLGYRILKANLFLHKLGQRMPMPGNAPNLVSVLPPAELAEAQQLMSAYYSASEQLAAELERLAERESRVIFKDNLHGAVSDEDKERLNDLQLGYGAYCYAETLTQLHSELGRFAIAGEMNNGPTRFTARPSLTQLDKSLLKSALSHLDSAVRLSKRERPEKRDDATVAALDDYAESLLFLGRKEEAVGKWQQVLDGFPTHRRYKEVEKKVQDVLCASPECRQFESSLKACDANLMMKVHLELPRVARVGGSEGLKRVADSLKANCTQLQPHMTYNISQMSGLQGVAMQALALGDCKLFRETEAFIKEKAGEIYTSTFSMWSACR